MSFVGGVTAANVASGANAANAATSSNTASTIVKRDASGNFAAQNVTMVDGIVSGFISIPTTSSLTVGMIQQNGTRFIHSFGTSNTFVGQNSGNFTTSGTGLNTAVGVSALSGNTTGNSNTAIGANALIVNTTGTFNTALGFNALSGNTTGATNTAVGARAGTGITTGSSNVIVGGIAANISNNRK